MIRLCFRSEKKQRNTIKHSRNAYRRSATFTAILNVKRGDLLCIRFDAVNCGDTSRVRFESVSVQTYTKPYH